MTIQNTDLLLVNRGGSNYQASAAAMGDYITYNYSRGGGGLPGAGNFVGELNYVGTDFAAIGPIAFNPYNSLYYAAVRASVLNAFNFYASPDGINWSYSRQVTVSYNADGLNGAWAFGPTAAVFFFIPGGNNPAIQSITLGLGPSADPLSAALVNSYNPGISGDSFNKFLGAAWVPSVNEFQALYTVSPNPATWILYRSSNGITWSGENTDLVTGVLPTYRVVGPDSSGNFYSFYGGSDYNVVRNTQLRGFWTPIPNTDGFPMLPTFSNQPANAAVSSGAPGLVAWGRLSGQSSSFLSRMLFTADYGVTWQETTGFPTYNEGARSVTIGYHSSGKFIAYAYGRGGVGLGAYYVSSNGTSWTQATSNGPFNAAPSSLVSISTNQFISNNPNMLGSYLGTIASPNLVSWALSPSGPIAATNTYTCYLSQLTTALPVTSLSEGIVNVFEPFTEPFLFTSDLSPQVINVQVGDSATLDVGVVTTNEDPVTLSYSWTSPGDFPIVGATSSTLQLSNIQEVNTGEYVCTILATNTGGEEITGQVIFNLAVWPLPPV